MPRRVTWLGSKPERCQVSGVPLVSAFSDARIPGGGWAIVCDDCFARLRLRYGTGLGQRYEKQDEDWVKTQG